MSRQSRRLICQTAHGSLSTNTVLPTQPVSVSKARPRASRSSSAVEGRRATDETQRAHYAQSASSQEKRPESRSPQPNEVYEPSTQSSRNTVFTQSSPEDREVDKEQGDQPKDWSCNKVKPQSHTSSGSRTAGLVSPLDVWVLERFPAFSRRSRGMSKFRQSRRLIGDKNFKPHAADVAGILNYSTRNNSATHNRTGRQKDCISGSMVASAGSRLQASQKFLAKSVHPQTITEAFFRAFR